MKKLVGYLLMLFVSIAPSGVYAQMPWDFAYHALPTSITLDIPEEVGQTAGNLQSAINQSQQIILQGKADISNMQSAATTTFNNIKSGAILEVDGLPGQSKSGGYCGYDIEDIRVRQMAKKMQEILLTYKNDRIAYKNAAMKQRYLFYINNIYSIYIESIIMQHDVENEIK